MKTSVNPDGPRRLVDPLTGSEVLISPERESRPKDESETPDNKCPFCPGNEQLTPPTLLSVPQDTPDNDWQVRVFTNLYPFFPSDANDPEYGIHEVVVETRQHDAELYEMPLQNISRLLTIVRQRMRHHQDNEHLEALLLFRNQGVRGGASLKHPHSQLVGLSFVPPRLASEAAGFLRMAEQGYCPLCLDSSDGLIIMEEGSFRAFSPPCPRFPREVWVSPVHHESAFTSLKNQELDDMASLMKRILTGLSKINSGTGGRTFDYNLVLHTEPLNDESGTFHMHMEILPRPEAFAGFELGSGALVNPVSPLQAVAELREVVLS